MNHTKQRYFLYKEFESGTSCRREYLLVEGKPGLEGSVVITLYVWRAGNWVFQWKIGVSRFDAVTSWNIARQEGWHQ